MVIIIIFVKILKEYIVKIIVRDSKCIIDKFWIYLIIKILVQV
jgi:hypothetical protein